MNTEFIEHLILPQSDREISIKYLIRLPCLNDIYTLYSYRNIHKPSPTMETPKYVEFLIMQKNQKGIPISRTRTTLVSIVDSKF